MTAHGKPLELDEVRSRLGAARGKDYWRSLEELADSDAFRELIEREFPRHAPEWNDSLSRRQFLALAAASLGLAGLSGCAAPAPRETIVPYTRPPDGLTPGQPLYFATAMSLAGDTQGLLVKSHEGRPTKVDGNPDHPATPRPTGSPRRVRYGASDMFAQASVLDLYDPDRSQSVTHLGDPNTREGFGAAFVRFMNEHGGAGGRGLRLRVLTETVVSPTVHFQLRQLTKRFPQARWHVYEPTASDNPRTGARWAFGEVVETHYRLDRADIVVALDSDLLSCGAGHVRHLHDFAVRRRVRQGQTQRMNRLYAVESMLTTTGAFADERLPLRSLDVEAFARALAARLDARFQPLAGGANAAIPQAWIEALARDLLAHRGASVIVAGERQSPVVHAIAHALNDFLGNVGQTIRYTAPVDRAEAEPGSLRELVDDMRAGRVRALVILGGNPVYTAPADMGFADALGPVGFRVHLSLRYDESSDLCHWHLPQAHFLESWGDARSRDGTVSLVQPLIAPLYGGRTAAEVLAAIADHQERGGYELVRGYWRSLFDRSHANHAVVRLGSGGQLALYNALGQVDAIVDLNGYYTN